MQAGFSPASCVPPPNVARVSLLLPLEKELWVTDSPEPVLALPPPPGRRCVGPGGCQQTAAGDWSGSGAPRKQAALTPASSLA